MVNPSSKWDAIPVFGFFFKDDSTPEVGRVTLSVTQRVTRVDGRRVYTEGATVSRTVGVIEDADIPVRDAVRAAWRAADQAAQGGSFDGAAWDAWWNESLTGAIFASFPAADDPDIIHDPDNLYQVKVEEKVPGGKVYYIQPQLSDLATAPPGINLGTVDVPPGAPSAPLPIYQKGVPGGVAALAADDGSVLDGQGNKITGGVPADLAAVATTGDYGDLLNKPTIPSAPSDIGAATAAQGAKADTAVQPGALATVATTGSYTNLLNKPTIPTTAAGISDFNEAAQDAVAAMLAQGTGVTLSYNDAGNTLTITSTATGGVTDPEVVRDTIGAALVGVGVITVAINDAADTITISSTATANSTDAQLRDRTTHTGLLPLSGVAAGSRLDCPLDGTTTTNANLARPSARTDIHFTWNSTVQPVNMIAGDKWDMPA